MKIALVAALAAAGMVVPAAEPRPGRPRPYPAMTVVWADEFSGAAGTRPRTDRWHVEKIDLSTEQQTYVDDRRTSAHDGQGHMVLRAIRENSGTRPFISARLSAGFVEWNGTGIKPRHFTYGRWEARLLMPAAAGIWPAFWGLGDWTAHPSWPDVGEIDVVELTDLAPVTHGGVHTTAANGTGHRNLGGSYPAPGGSWAGAWHVWAIDWSPGRITWSVDGYAWQTVTRAQVEAIGGRWVFDGYRPQAPILNLAVGGPFPGPVGNWTSAQMLVDYVRIYSPLSGVKIGRPSRQPVR